MPRRNARNLRAAESPEVDDELLGPAAGESMQYIEQNRAAWERWAVDYVVSARKAWGETELRWGLWSMPESELRLLDDIAPGSDVIELGSGAAVIPAWLARHDLRPVAVDFSQAQLNTAERLQREFGVYFPLVVANAEDVPFDTASFDIAFSEYGASHWCDPRRWLPEASRLLRPGGVLFFIVNSPMLIACTPPEGGRAGDRLFRDLFADRRVEFPADGTVEFHLTHGQWIRVLRATGFRLENLIEVRPPRGAKPKFEFASVEWARRWPSEEIWIARKTG